MTSSTPRIIGAAVLALASSGAFAADETRPPIVLAQEFLLPAPGPPRATCNSIVNAGTTAPETIPVDISGTTGTIEFQYDTVAQPDRMVVFIDRQLVFDTGCIGTNGFRSRNIPLPEGAMILTVRIQPNCAGGGFTAWNFKLVCPQ